MVQLTINGKESEVQTEWLAGGIPEHSAVSLFFVRTQACLRQVFQRGWSRKSYGLGLSACPAWVQPRLAAACQPPASHPQLRLASSTPTSCRLPLGQRFDSRDFDTRSGGGEA